MSSGTGASSEVKSSEEEYVNAILTLRNGKTLPDSAKYEELMKTVQPIDALIKRMESINQTISKLSDTDTFSVEQHLSYMLEKGYKFTDRRYDMLFSSTKQPGYSLSLRRERKAKDLYRGYYERLTGFIQKEGEFLWDKEKIEEFILSIKNT